MQQGLCLIIHILPNARFPLNSQLYFGGWYLFKLINYDGNDNGDIDDHDDDDDDDGDNDDVFSKNIWREKLKNQ